MRFGFRGLGPALIAASILATFPLHLTAQEGSNPTAIGGTTISAGIADAQTQLNQALNISSDPGTDSLAQFTSEYQASGGGPTLAFLGFNPFQFIAAGAFNYLYWSFITILLGAMAVVATGRAVREGQSGDYRPLFALARVYFRLLLGVLFIANTPLIYGVLMTLSTVLTQGVQAMAAQSPAVSAMLQAGGIGTLTLAQAREEAIRNAAARRAVGLYPSGASRDEMTQVGGWYNAMANAINASLAAQNMSGQLPVLNASVWTNSQTPDDQVLAYVGRTVVQNFGQLVADLGSLPASGGSLSIAFPSAGATSLSLLSGALAQDDAQAAQALTLPNTPSSSSQFEAARSLYGKNVQADTLTYLDTQLLPVVGASPTLAQRVKAWFSERVEQAAAAAGGFMTYLRASVDWVGRSIGVVLARMVAFVFAAATRALLEINLFVLVLAMPFWLLPSTEGAFYGVLRSLVSLSVVVPAYQFLMLFVDALMALTLRYVIFGPLATSSSGVLQTSGGAAYMTAVAAIAFCSGGEVIALVTLCYLVAYLFLAVYIAIKTPKLITLFLQGAGVAGAFVSSFATGLIAGVATTLLASVVAGGAGAGGGIVGRLLGGAGVSRGFGPSVPLGGGGLSVSPVRSGGEGSSTSYSWAPEGSPVRPSLGRVVSARLSRPIPPPTPMAPAVARPPSLPSPGSSAASHLPEALTFGLRTFVDALSAETPGHGFKIALGHLDEHLKRKDAEEEKRHRAMIAEEARRRGGI